MKRIPLHLNLATLKVVLIILNQSLIAIDLLMLMLQQGMHNWDLKNPQYAYPNGSHVILVPPPIDLRIDRYHILQNVCCEC